MLLFCPTCSNVLTVSTVTTADDPTPTNRLECLTCPYEYVLTKRVFERKTFTHVKKDDVFGGDDEFKNASKINVQCDNRLCESGEAVTYELQIRGGDEPTTQFFMCTKCTTKWRSG
ncbi:hypothetical protein B7494_g7030 [Chlorociboria aeruginascens]|nr:hypothetical protein B7494_g7030 [Chlorociboria aeruginascens]